MCSQSGSDRPSGFLLIRVVLCLRKLLHSSGPHTALVWKLLPFGYNSPDLRVWGDQRRKCLEWACPCGHPLLSPPSPRQSPLGWRGDAFPSHYWGGCTPQPLRAAAQADIHRGPPSVNLAFLHLHLSFPVLSPNHTPSPRISVHCFHSGISRAGLWIHPEGRVNSLLVGSKTQSRMGRSTLWTLIPSEGGHWVILYPSCRLLGQGQGDDGSWSGCVACSGLNDVSPEKDKPRP